MLFDAMGLSDELRGQTLPVLGSASFWFSIIGSVVLAIIPIIAINAYENSKDTELNRVLVRERTKIFADEKEAIEEDQQISSAPEDIIAPIQNVPEISGSVYPDAENPTGYAFEPPVASFETVKYGSELAQRHFGSVSSAQQLKNKIQLKLKRNFD